MYVCVCIHKKTKDKAGVMEQEPYVSQITETGKKWELYFKRGVQVEIIPTPFQRAHSAIPYIKRV